jgi:spore coat protein U-like protein
MPKVQDSFLDNPDALRHRTHASSAHQPSGPIGQQESQMLRYRRSVRIAVGALAAAGTVMTMSLPAFGASASTTLGVSAAVANNCTITTGGVSFGTYDPLSATDTDSTGSVTITCTKGTTATVALDTGANASGAVRRMNDGSGNYLTYELYHPANVTPGAGAAYTTVWGTSGANLFSPAAAPSKAGRTFTVSGRITAGQDVAAGGFSDTVQATVNF